MSQSIRYDARTFRSTGIRCNGTANVGDVIGYSDMANCWEPEEVLAIVVDAKYGYTNFTLLSLETGTTRTATLGQHGWTFGVER